MRLCAPDLERFETWTPPRAEEVEEPGELILARPNASAGGIMSATRSDDRRRRNARPWPAARWTTVAVAGLVLLLGAGPLIAQGKVQKVSKKLVDRAEDTLKKIKDAEKQLDKTTDRYGDLIGGKNVKARRKQHAKVRDELKKLESRASAVREQARDMEKEASKFFREWDKGLDGIKDPQLRALSRQSMTESQEQYGQIIKAGRSVADQYDAYGAMLANQLKYLELDLSDNAIEKLKGTNQDLRGEAKELRSRVNGFKSEIKRYIAALK
jgi:DNA repair exonuclease SbcCD ATPase subunit